MKFSKKQLQEWDLPWGGAEEGDDGYVVEDLIVDTSRWSLNHELIFFAQGKYWSTGYSVGATESQDERPWEYEDEIECIEVHQVEKTIKVWEPV